MEYARYLRIALPPFVFYGAAILAHALNSNLASTLNDWKDAQAVIAAIVAASILPLGYVIGGLTQLVLRSLGKVRFGKRWLLGKGRFDLLYEDEVTDLLLDDLKVTKPRTPDDRINAARTFVYEARDKWWLADFLNRLWDASMAYAGSVFAVFLAMGYVRYTLNHRCVWWWVLAIATIVICWIMAWHTRCQIKEVVTFQIRHRNLIRQKVEDWQPARRTTPEK